MYALNAEIRFTEKVSLMQNGHFAVVAKGFGESLLTITSTLIYDDILDSRYLHDTFNIQARPNAQFV